MANELIVLNNELVNQTIDPATVFTHGGLEEVICAISEKAKEEAAGLTPETDKGRKAFGSLCRKISSSKVFIESAVKRYESDLKAKLDPIVKERIRFVKAMSELNDEIDKPRQEWLAKEEAKVAAANAVMKDLHDAVIVFSGTTAAELAKRIEAVEQTDIESLPEEYIANAEKMRDDALTKLYAEHDNVVKREAEAAELEKLRQEAAARAEADRKAKEAAEREEREKRLKAEAAETARREAEEKAAAEIRKAKEAQEAAERREKEAEAKRIADEEEARIAYQKAIDKSLQAAKEEADKKERERLAEVERQRVAEEKRIANKKHRAKVKSEATAAMVSKFGLSQDQANLEFDTYSAGTVPHITVNY